MWKVRETKPIGIKTFWELYRVLPSGDTITKGRYTYRAEAEELADRLNKEAGYYERIQ